MAIKKLAWLLTACCLLLGCVCAQSPNYQTTYGNITFSDSTTACAASGNSVCFVLVSTSPVITQVSAGDDGTVYSLDAHGNLWKLSGRTWNSSALSPMAQISVANANLIYAVQANAACTSPEKLIYKYTGGVDFVSTGQCAANVAVAPDGTVYRIRGGGGVSHLVGTSWVTDPTAGGNGTPVKVAVGSKQNVWVITSTNLIKVLNASGSFVLAPGTATDIAADSLVDAWIIGPTVGVNNVYKFNVDTGTWTLMVGNMSKIASGDRNHTFGLAANGNVYHWNTVQLSQLVQTTGNYNCYLGGYNFCPNGSYHTAKVTLSFGKGGHGGTNTFGGAPANNLNASLTGFTTECDVMFADPNDPACQATVEGEVDCSMMGPIFYETSGPLNWLLAHVEIAFTTSHFTGQVSNCTTKPVTGIRMCQYSVENWCTPETSPPDFSVNGGTTKDIAGLTSPLFWEGESECVRASVMDTWYCGGDFPLFDFDIALRTQGVLLPLAACTHNP